jgi:hypothetical protein
MFALAIGFRRRVDAGGPMDKGSSSPAARADRDRCDGRFDCSKARAFSKRDLLSHDIQENTARPNVRCEAPFASFAKGPSRSRRRYQTLKGIRRIMPSAPRAEAGPSKKKAGRRLCVGERSSGEDHS